MGCYCAAKVTGTEAIMTMISEPTVRCAYGMCGTFRFHAAGSPLHRPALTKGRDLGPFIGVWVS
jgi:hypothetical protein